MPSRFITTATVVLEDDPLDITDEVFGHDRKLPGIDPELPVLLNGDRDNASTILQSALARDLDTPAQGFLSASRNIPTSTARCVRSSSESISYSAMVGADGHPEEAGSSSTP